MSETGKFWGCCLSPSAGPDRPHLQCNTQSLIGMVGKHQWEDSDDRVVCTKGSATLEKLDPQTLEVNHDIS